MEPSIKVIGASIARSKNSRIQQKQSFSVIPSTGFPPTSTGFRLLPQNLHVYICISYHELQALPPWGQEGRSFPSICIYRIPSVCLGSNGVVGDSKKCFVARGSPGGGTEMPSLTTGLILGGEHRINIIRSSASYPYYIIRLRRRHWDL